MKLKDLFNLAEKGKIKCRYCDVFTEGGYKGNIRHLIDVHSDKIDVDKARKLVGE